MIVYVCCMDYGLVDELQHRKQRRQSLAEWQRKREERQSRSALTDGETSLLLQICVCSLAASRDPGHSTSGPALSTWRTMSSRMSKSLSNMQWRIRPGLRGGGDAVKRRWQSSRTTRRVFVEYAVDDPTSLGGDLDDDRDEVQPAGQPELLLDLVLLDGEYRHLDAVKGQGKAVRGSRKGSGRRRKGNGRRMIGSERSRKGNEKPGKAVEAEGHAVKRQGKAVEGQGNAVEAEGKAVEEEG